MTRTGNQNKALLLVFGDLVVYLFSLILTLSVRYGELPTKTLLSNHVPSFTILFVLFAVVGFSAGLYDKQFSFARGRIQGLLMKTQIVNIFIGIAFFYVAPVAITPRANLAIFFVISTALLFVWRTIMFPVLSVSRAQAAILIGDGIDIEDLYREVNSNVRYSLFFKEFVSPAQHGDALAMRIGDIVAKTDAQIIVADLRNRAVEPIMSLLYSQVFSGKQIIDAGRLYESIFDRIPLSMVGERWFVENAGSTLGGRRIFDSIKRVMDIVIAGVIGLLSLVIYPFIYIAIKLDDGGPAFIYQQRIGKDGKIIKMAKWRSMTSNDSGRYGAGGKSANKVTRVGRFIRLTRIDELPQLWSVLKGDQSLIGPRPELPSLVNIYEKEIPYYHFRHLIKPGLSGWAQIYHRAHPHHAIAVNDTRDKLYYDLYYVKNRSLALDVKIALQTAKALLSRQGV